MTFGYNDHKQRVLKRLKRAEGQVRGVANMVEADKYCIDVMTQINAAQAALDKVAIELLRDHTQHCVMEAKVGSARDQKTEELVMAVQRMISR
jgi:DNA-binding FrmR family transcriptional regulator